VNYGDKNSGGTGFVANHTVSPMAVYAPEVEKTFFVYGGTTGPEDRYLLAMASYYDHKRHRVPRPTIVRDQRGIDDPHDNPCLTIDEAGYVCFRPRTSELSLVGPAKTLSSAC